MLSHLSQGAGTWDGIYYGQNESRYKEDIELSKNIGSCYHRHGTTVSPRIRTPQSNTRSFGQDGQILLPKTFFTRKGALMLVTAPETVDGMRKSDYSLIREKLKQMQFIDTANKLKTVHQLRKNVLKFGDEVLFGDDESRLFLDFLHYLDYQHMDMKTQPGSDVSSYLADLKKYRLSATTRSATPDKRAELVEAAKRIEEDSQDFHVFEKPSSSSTGYGRNSPSSASRASSGYFSARSLSASIRSNSYLGRPVSAEGYVETPDSVLYDVESDNSKLHSYNSTSFRPMSAHSAKIRRKKNFDGTALSEQNEDSDLDSIMSEGVRNVSPTSLNDVDLVSEDDITIVPGYDPLEPKYNVFNHGDGMFNIANSGKFENDNSLNDNALSDHFPVKAVFDDNNLDKGIPSPPPPSRPDSPFSVSESIVNYDSDFDSNHSEEYVNAEENIVRKVNEDKDEEPAVNENDEPASLDKNEAFDLKSHTMDSGYNSNYGNLNKNAAEVESCFTQSSNKSEGDASHLDHLDTNVKRPFSGAPYPTVTEDVVSEQPTPLTDIEQYALTKKTKSHSREHSLERSVASPTKLLKGRPQKQENKLKSKHSVEKIQKVPISNKVSKTAATAQESWVSTYSNENAEPPTVMALNKDLFSSTSTLSQKPDARKSARSFDTKTPTSTASFEPEFEKENAFKEQGSENNAAAGELELLKQEINVAKKVNSPSPGEKKKIKSGKTKSSPRKLSGKEKSKENVKKTVRTPGKTGVPEKSIVEEEREAALKQKRIEKEKRLEDARRMQLQIQQKEIEKRKEMEEIQKQQQEIEEQMDLLSAEAQDAMATEDKVRDLLLQGSLEAHENRIARRKQELENKRREELARLKAEKQKRIIQRSRELESSMLEAIPDADMLKRKDEDIKRLENEQNFLIQDAIDKLEEDAQRAAELEEEAIAEAERKAEEENLAELRRKRLQAQLKRQELEERVILLKEKEEQKKQELLEEKKRLEDERKKQEQAEIERREAERQKMLELQRMEDQARQKMRADMETRREAALKRREINLEAKRHLNGLRITQGLTRPWVFSYFVHWPRETYEKSMGVEVKGKSRTAKPMKPKSAPAGAS